MPLILLAPNAKLAQQVPAVLTIEAEYGSIVWEGSHYTAAHHQPVGSVYAGRHLPGLALTGRPSPCNDPSIPVVESGIIGVSHLDLDTFGGLFRSHPVRGHEFSPGVGTHFGPETQAFWDLAEKIDVNGAHRLPEMCSDPVLAAQLNGFWAWSHGRPRAPWDRVTDVTSEVDEAALVLLELFVNDPARLEAGAAFVAGEDALNARTFRYVTGTGVGGPHVVVRQAEDRVFVNHLYRTPGRTGDLHEAIVGWDRTAGTVTISIANPGEWPHVSCRAIVQSLWGPEAGGHPGIAGGPRGLFLAEAEANRATEALLAAMGRSACGW